jgi:hypothetical protein
MHLRPEQSLIPNLILLSIFALRHINKVSVLTQRLRAKSNMLGFRHYALDSRDINQDIETNLAEEYFERGEVVVEAIMRCLFNVIDSPTGDGGVDNREAVADVLDELGGIEGEDERNHY